MKEFSEKEPKIKKRRVIKYICTAVIAAAVLAAAYFAGDSVPERKTASAPPASSSASTSESSFSSARTTAEEVTVSQPEITTTAQAEASAPEAPSVTETSKKPSAPAETSETASPAPQVTTAAPAEPVTSSSTTTTPEPPVTTTATTTTPPKAEHTVSLLISCENAVKPDSGLADSIRAELPGDGLIFYSQEFEIERGDTVYDIISRACHENGIPMESSRIAMSSDMYIEGIANLYEFDCGQLSGWMYSVNGDFPQLSTSQVEVNDGDEIRLLYSCNIGRDVGDNYYS